MNKRSICLTSIACLSLFAGVDALQAQQTIKGVVHDADDASPLIGANIYVPQSELKRVGAKSDNLGTITDLNGAFTLIVPEGVRLVHVRYVGYAEYELKLKPGQTSYSIALKGNTKLDELVVTGYQTTERRKLTAAIGKVELSDAVLGSVKSVDQALAGQIAGVSVTNASGTPGAPARIRIRGTASLNGTQDPLWVLDGIPLEGTDIPKLEDSSSPDIANIGQSSIAGISPADIADITILKDAAATAIYGARAANGVIVITTKKGRSGRTNVNFSSKLSYSPTYSIDRLNLLSSADKVNLELDLMSKPLNPILGTAAYYTKGGVASILSKYNLFDAYRERGSSALTPEALAEIEALKGINTDWNDILFRNALTQEYNLSVSGGNDKTTHYTSLGYTNEEGNVQGVGLQRFNLTAKISHQFTNKFKVGASVFLNRRSNLSDVSDKNGLVNPVYYSRTVNPYTQPYDSKGAYVYNYDLSSGAEADPDKGFNIFEERDNTERKSTTTGINAIFDAEYKFDKSWKLSSQLGLQWEQLKVDEHVGEASFTMRDLRRESRYYDRTTRTNKYLLPTGGRHTLQNRVTEQLTWKGMLEYKNTFGTLHALHVMLGSELRTNRYDFASSTAYGYDAKTLTSKPIIFRDENDAKRYPLTSESLVRNAFVSTFATGSYTFANRYTLGASVRIDGSDLFGVDERYRYLPIYSLSGLWRISNESFMQSAKWLDNLALRASYGLQGNVDKNTSPYLLGTYRRVSILPGSSLDVIEIDAAPNAKLRWEKTASYNLGLDLAVLGQAINLSVDYYYRRGTDLIGTRMLPLENGFTSMSINWAELENRGVEINLSTRNITTPSFSWYSNINFAYNQNKVLRETKADNDPTPSREGYPVGAIFAVTTSGIDPNSGRILVPNAEGKGITLEEKYKVVDESGIGFYSVGASEEERRQAYRYIGTSDAPFTGGFNNTFSYKGWELNINMSYHLGAHVRTAPTYPLVDIDMGRNTNADILNRWTESNKTATLPALLNANDHTAADYSLLTQFRQEYNNLDLWVRPLSYLRLQNLRLAYSLPKDFVSKLGLKGATVALEGRNLFVWGTSYRNYLDPESMGNLYATPVPRTFTFNLNLSL